jgi:hypothetical protein
MKNDIAVIAAVAMIVCAAGFAGAQQFALEDGLIEFPIEIVTASALPAVPAPSAEAPKQTYGQLAADFDKASAPALEDLLAWHAGRVFEKDYPDYPGALLLAGWYVPTATLTHATFKLVALTPGVPPSFYENLEASLVPGLKSLLDAVQADWTTPDFSAAGVKFEKTLPSYNKGFSRFEIRRTADKRLLLKNTWKTDLGGLVTAGTAYATLTKNVTPK